MIQKQHRLPQMLPLLALAAALALSCPRMALAANTASTQVTLSVSSSDAGGNNNSSAGSGNTGNNTATSDNGNSPSGTTSTIRSGQTHGAKTGDEAPAELLLFLGLALMSASVIFLVIGKREPEKHLTSHKNL